MINYHKTALENTFEARTIIKDFLSISVIILDSFFPDKISSSDKTAWYQDFLDQFLLKHDLSGKRTYILGSLSSRVLEIKFTELLLRHHFSFSCVCLRFNLPLLSVCPCSLPWWHCCHLPWTQEASLFPGLCGRQQILKIVFCSTAWS